LEQDERVLDSENDLLIAPFFENEIKEGVWSCYAEGASGHMGFPLCFILSFGSY